MPAATPPFLGLRTAIHPAPDLAAAKAWFTALLGTEPYFDTDFYVGYSVGGYELGLDPNADPGLGVVTYWGVADMDAAHARLLAAGAAADGPIQEVGDRIRTATVRIPTGGVLGIIENPHFSPEPTSGSQAGPGR